MTDYVIEPFPASRFMLSYLFPDGNVKHPTDWIWTFAGRRDYIVEAKLSIIEGISIVSQAYCPDVEFFVTSNAPSAPTQTIGGDLWSYQDVVGLFAIELSGRLTVALDADPYKTPGTFEYEGTFEWEDLSMRHWRISVNSGGVRFWLTFYLRHT